MFTGIIEALGVVHQIIPRGPAKDLVVREPRIACELQLGESIAVNGACLTVVDRSGDMFTFQAGPETLAKTNLAALTEGDRINLERSLRVGDRLGGHWVQGHVDGVGRIHSRSPQGNWDLVWFSCALGLTSQMVPKGSIAVDGVSLTLVEVAGDRFSVALIPHTLTNTTLGFKSVGDEVNLETDILGKYVLRLIAQTRS